MTRQSPAELARGLVPPSAKSSARAGTAAREWIEELTRDPSTVRITATHGYDRMDEPRLPIDLSVNGQDVGLAGIDTTISSRGRMMARQLAEKPDW